MGGWVGGGTYVPAECKKEEESQPDPLVGEDVLVEEGDGGVAPACFDWVGGWFE